MAAGRFRDAGAAADEILRRAAWDHAAIALKIAAAARTTAIAALDTYEHWLGSRTSDDVYLLEPVALAVLQDIATGSDRGLQIQALERLSRHGETSARAQLRALATSTPGVNGADVALAALGDAPAVSRLQAAASTARADLQLIATGLGNNGGAASVSTLVSILTDAIGPARAAAAASLGRLHAAAATEALQLAAQDPEPLLRTSALVALARIGNPDARAQVETMLSSEVPDFRLMAAEAWEGRQGPWVAALEPILQNDAGLLRLQAARLLAPVRPDAAADTLRRASADGNPVVRAEAVRTLEQLAADGTFLLDVATLRHMLREADPAIRLSAAAALLARVRGQR